MPDMAKKSKIARNNLRKEVVARYREKRTALRDIIKSANASWEERLEAQRKMARFPRLSMEVRIRNRCRLTGRCRGFLRKFEMSRLEFRKNASFGLIPGVTKSSW